MKKLIVLSAIVILLVTSCIPSLHPLVDTEDALIDDRIEGLWTMGSNVTIEFDSLTVESDDEEVDQKALEEELKLSIQEMVGNAQSAWRFSRAYDIKWVNPQDSSTISMKPVHLSDAPEGYVVMEKEALPYYLLEHSEFERKDTVVTKLAVYLTEIAGEKFMDFIPLPGDDKKYEGRFGVNYIMGHTFARYELTDEGLSLMPIDGQYIEKLIKRKRIRLKHEVIYDDTIILTASTEELRAFIAKYIDDEDLYAEVETLTPVIPQ